MRTAELERQGDLRACDPLSAQNIFILDKFSDIEVPRCKGLLSAISIDLSRIDPHAYIVEEVNCFLLAKVVAALVKHCLFVVDNLVFRAIFIIAGSGGSLCDFSSHGLIERANFDSDIVLRVRSQVDFADLKARGAVRSDVGRAEAHRLVTV